MTKLTRVRVPSGPPEKKEVKFDFLFQFMHFVYILYSSTNDQYYKGYTSNLEVRVQQHNNGESRFTAGKGPWTLVYFESYDNKTEALLREKVLKRLNRASILKLINQQVEP